MLKDLEEKMYKRDTAEFRAIQSSRIEMLIGEAVKGVTKRDTLPNSAQPLQGEVEVVYFKKMRDFMENVIVKRIINAPNVENRELF